jgi:hypothetical protein
LKSVDWKTEGGAVGVTGAAGTGSGVKSGCDTGPLMADDCEGAGNGAGIRLSTVLGSGLGKFTRGGNANGRGGRELHVVPTHTCALATVTGATARIRTTRTLVSGRMTRSSIAVPLH